MPGRYTGGSSTGLGQGKRIDSSLDSEQTNCHVSELVLMAGYQPRIVELLRHKILQIEVEAWNLAQTYFLPF